eukprot:TRINITY_DN3427_c0_g1_i1.p1 TRINITY_DN3427_c0_g1~~TRINITY_DN3427_c0_g1_i1.p1  ORF type:complete len:688 (+),score=255.60 TRINITY_DN3427_c0_g1_i1:95-2158(+)
MACLSSRSYFRLEPRKRNVALITAAAIVVAVICTLGLTTVLLIRNVEKSITAPEVTKLEVSSLCDPAASPFKATVKFRSPVPFGVIEVEPFQLRLHDSAGNQLVTCNLPGFALQPWEDNEVDVDSAFVVSDVRRIRDAVSDALAGNNREVSVQANIQARWLGFSKSIDISQALSPSTTSSANGTDASSGGSASGGDKEIGVVVNDIQYADGSLKVPINLGGLLQGRRVSIAMPPLAVDVVVQDGERTVFGTIRSPSTTLDNEHMQLTLEHSLADDALPALLKGLVSGRLAVQVVGQPANDADACGLGQQVVQNVTVFESPVVAGQVSFTPEDIIDKAVLPFMVPLSIQCASFSIQLPTVYSDLMLSGEVVARLSADQLQLSQSGFTGQLGLVVYDKDAVYSYLNNANRPLTIVTHTDSQLLFQSYFEYYSFDWNNLWSALTPFGDGVRSVNGKTWTDQVVTQFGAATMYCASVTVQPLSGRRYWWSGGQNLAHFAIDIMYQFSPLVRPQLALNSEYYYGSGERLSAIACADVYDVALAQRLYADFSNNLVPQGISVVIGGRSVDISYALGALWTALGYYDFNAIDIGSFSWSQLATIQSTNYALSLDSRGRFQNLAIAAQFALTPQFQNTIASLPIISSFQSFGPATAMPVIVNSDDNYVISGSARADYTPPLFSFELQANGMYAKK